MAQASAAPALELDFGSALPKYAGIEEAASSSGSFCVDLELDRQQQRQCRICLECGGSDLIAPCQCKGTQKFVHRSCLDNWRAVKEGFAFSHCTECRSVFQMRVNRPPDRWWLRLKFQLLVFRDHTVIFVLVQVVVILLGALVYAFYGEELKEMFGYDEQHAYGFYALAVLVLILVGLLYGFFIAIICGRKITNRHYHVLEKQDLTKEYIVEGLDDDEEEEQEQEEQETSLAPSPVAE
ncbi:E3 ubiquitin-protein ligase MARCH8 [Selaginella moellendorffii]|nr:E3 ubiquitin-protein ligase MARCH8 [Selaginella moellendorffii]|eukprot:XP_002989200.2 E3 ubiquitin-protein ligase MARCH8 [Selaginella moellendorffii]